MEQNQTDQATSQSASSGTDEIDAELKPWIHDLLDIRVIMYLVSTGVIAMTATVLLLSNEDEVGEINPAGQTSTVGADVVRDGGEASAVAVNSADGGESEVVDSMPENASEPKVSKLTVRQESDGSFNLPIRLAKVSGCEAKSSGISGWSIDGKARWELAIEDRKTGYFRCFITYRSKYEGSLDICLGDRRPVKFYALPQDSDFTEQVMVRLGKPESPTLSLIAKEIDSNSDLIITRIRMVPR
jgi:hypothetical protein